MSLILGSLYTCMCTIIQIRAYNLNVNFLCKGRDHGNEAGAGFHFVKGKHKQSIIILLSQWGGGGGGGGVRK